VQLEQYATNTLIFGNAKVALQIISLEIDSSAFCSLSFHWVTWITKGKVLSWEYRSPRKRNSRPPASVILCWVNWVENVLLIYYASSDLLVYIGKNPRFTAFLDSNLHTRLAIVTENELGLAFPPRNLPKKFRPDPSTFYSVIVVTNRQTDRQTNQRRWLHNPSRKLSRG